MRMQIALNLAVCRVVRPVSVSSELNRAYCTPDPTTKYCTQYPVKVPYLCMITVMIL